MSRVLHSLSPTKIRNQHRRTVAEILRRMMKKQEVDAETKDMASMLVFILLELQEGVEKSVEAWEKRGYWMKAERFLRQWDWTKAAAANLDDVIRHEAWDLIPELMMELVPHFADIDVKSFTRKPSTWQGAHAKLLEKPALDLPY